MTHGIRVLGPLPYITARLTPVAEVISWVRSPLLCMESKKNLLGTSLASWHVCLSKENHRLISSFTGACHTFMSGTDRQRGKRQLLYVPYTLYTVRPITLPHHRELTSNCKLSQITPGTRLTFIPPFLHHFLRLFNGLSLTVDARYFNLLQYPYSS